MSNFRFFLGADILKSEDADERGSYVDMLLHPLKIDKVSP